MATAKHADKNADMSYGFTRTETNPALKGREQVLDRVVPFALQNNIVVVVAAGNGGPGTSLDQVAPQNQGSSNIALITVGGLDNRGQFFKITTRDRARGGSITIHAGAKDVHIPDAQKDTGTIVDSGTSYAAPAVVSSAPQYSAYVSCQ